VDGPLVALVTGGNRGIGLEVCRQLAGRGYTMVLGSRDVEKGRRAATTIAGDRGRVLAWQLDVTSAEDIERARARAGEELGRLDALINNAAALRLAGLDGERDTGLQHLQSGAQRGHADARPRAPQRRHSGELGVSRVGRN
jgi:NAD(P)-dependent dehydrogenase (short-subunit alcohol dehydrogenase family)